jgi:pantothenate kinase
VRRRPQAQTGSTAVVAGGVSCIAVVKPRKFLNWVGDSSVHGATCYGLIMLVTGAAVAIDITWPGDDGGPRIQLLDPIIWDSAKNEIKYARHSEGLSF